MKEKTEVYIIDFCLSFEHILRRIRNIFPRHTLLTLSTVLFYNSSPNPPISDT